MKRQTMRSKIVERIPRHLEPGTLYFAKNRGIAMHLCCCGCLSEIMTRISGKDWLLKIHWDRPSLYPSIGNWDLPCRSHYVIWNGCVLWASDMTDHEIDKIRKADKKREETFDQFNATEQQTMLKEHRSREANLFWRLFR